MLAGAGADLILAGHEHFYERFAPVNAALQFRDSGARVVLVGTGGAALSNSMKEREPGAVLNLSAYGVLAIKLFERGYQAEFIDVDGQSRDQFDAGCHVK